MWIDLEKILKLIFCSTARTEVTREEIANLSVRVCKEMSIQIFRTRRGAELTIDVEKIEINDSAGCYVLIEKNTSINPDIHWNYVRVGHPIDNNYSISWHSTRSLTEADKMKLKEIIIDFFK